MAKLVVDKIAKSYPTAGEPLVVLREASFTLDPGQNLAILGPSGSGKSTLLQIIGTLDQPTAGTIALDGANPFQLDDRALAHFRNRNIGFIFQDHHLLPQLTVLENILVPTLAEGPTSRELVDRAHSLLYKVGLLQRANHRPAELSGGERQRAAVARALIYKPPLVLADEPTGSLDRANAQAIGRLLIDLQGNENSMLIVVTHSLELAGLLQRRCEIEDGHLKAAS